MLTIRRPSKRTAHDIFPQTNHRTSTEQINLSYIGTQADPRIGAEVIDHIDRIRGFIQGTYHYIVRTDGVVEIGRNPATISPRKRGYVPTHHAIHIGVVGGIDPETGKRIDSITSEQEEAIELLMQALADHLQLELEVHDLGITRWVMDADKDAIEEEALEAEEAAMDARER